MDWDYIRSYYNQEIDNLVNELLESIPEDLKGKELMPELLSNTLREGASLCEEAVMDYLITCHVIDSVDEEATVN